MEIIDFILCDYIRRELNNKVIIIGAYNDRIELIPHPENGIKWPMDISFSAYARLLNQFNTKFNVLDIYFNGKEQELFRQTVQIPPDVNFQRPIVISFHVPAIKIQGPCMLEATIVVKEDEEALYTLKPKINFEIAIQK